MSDQKLVSTTHSACHAAEVKEVGASCSSDSVKDTPDERSSCLTLRQKAAYAAPSVGVLCFFEPMLSIMPGVYAKTYGLPLTVIATITLLARCFDGVTDLLVGCLSDSHRALGGSRKLWVAAGGGGFIFACYHLYLPPVAMTASYYLTWLLVFYFFYTVFLIPHLAWGSEIAINYQDRADLYGVNTFSLMLGGLCFYGFSLLPFYSDGYTGKFFSEIFFVSATLMVVGLLCALLCAPDGKKPDKAHVVNKNFQQTIAVVRKNKPLLLYFSAYITNGLGYGMWFGLQYLYLGSYLGLEQEIPYILIVGSIVGLLLTPLWPKVIYKTSKHTTWMISIGLFSLQLIGMLSLNIGDPWWIPMLFIILSTVSFACHDVAAISAMGDIIDYGKWKFKRDDSSTYFAINNLLYKLGLGIGAALSLAIAGFMGFDPANEVHSAEAILGLQLGFVYIPLIFMIISIVFVAKTPITRHRHQLILRRLSQSSAV